MKNSKGFSLIEVVITVLIVTIAFVALTKGYLTIGKGLILTQNKTIAVNIAHEKVATLKKLTYPRLYVTTTTTPDYDTVYYPPVTYTIKKMDFTRYVTVKKVREKPDGSIEDIAASDPDEGLKRIKVEVKWTESERTKTFIIYNLRQNPDRAPLSGAITGRVRNTSGGTAIMGAMVYVVENPNWAGSTDENGDFEIKVSTGDWNLRVSEEGYFSKTNGTYTVTLGATTAVPLGDLDLTALGTGSVWGLVKSTNSIPIEGAIVTCNDETSTFAISLTTNDFPGDNQNFVLSDVSTGTWTIFATTGIPNFISLSIGLFGDTTNVIIPDESTYQYDIELDTWATAGSISGFAYKGDSGDHGGIKVSAGGSETTTNTTGYYKIENVAAGAVTVTVNSNADNPSYTTETTIATAAAGQNVQASALTIYPAGRISGTVYTAGGSDPFPGMVVTAIDTDSLERGSGLSGADGYYEITQVPTQIGLFTRNPYTVTPVLDAGDVSDPTSVSTDVVKGENASGCNFTITRAWGYISGTVKDNGEAITTGVLVIASVDAISEPPDDISVGESDKYGGISHVEGEYEIKVRVGYTYKVYAWYTEINNSWDGTETTRKGPIAAPLIGGLITAEVNFTW